MSEYMNNLVMTVFVNVLLFNPFMHILNICIVCLWYFNNALYFGSQGPNYF